MLAAFAYFSRCWYFCVRLKTIAYKNIVQIFCSILRCCGYDSFFFVLLKGFSKGEETCR